MDANQKLMDEAKALGLLMEALESYGSDALELGERARTLVGVDGIERIARTLTTGDNEPENGRAILGAISALKGQTSRDDDGDDFRYGFDFVASEGFFGAWRE